MANIAIVKLFTGLNLPAAQLSGELKRAGHKSRVIYLKEYITREDSDIGNYRVTEHPGIMTLLSQWGERKFVWNCYEPFTESEYQLLFEELRDFGADAVGFPVHSGIINDSAEVSKRVMAELGIPVIWGGPGPTLQPERCMPFADLLCVGEGEEVIVEFADKISRSESLTDIKGTWSRLDDGTIQKNGNRPLAPLDSIAIPNWNVEDYVHLTKGRLERDVYFSGNEDTEYALMTQRGCPFSCSFCIESKYQQMFGKKNSLRRRSPELVIEELLWAKEHLDIQSVWFWDDVFTINPSWHREFLPLYKEKIGIPFWCYTYPTTHNPELLKALKDAGCNSITMGVQSGSPRVLSEYFNRPTKPERVIAAAQEILDAGIAGKFDLITKNEVETEADLRQTFEFLLRFPKEMKTFGFMEMMSFPTYGYTQTVANISASGKQLPNASLSDDDYAYYHKLFALTRTDMPEKELRALADDPKTREKHQILDEYLDGRDFLKDLASWRNLAPLDEEALV